MRRCIRLGLVSVLWCLHGGSGAAQDASYLFLGDSAFDEFGFAASGAGDVDGDGVADIVVGAWQDDNNGIDSGTARVFAGKTGAVLYTFVGDLFGDNLGQAVGKAGDVDGDGYSDVIVGAPHAAFGTGYVRVYSGKNGSILYTFNGSGPVDEFGWAVDGVGDLNGDGHADLIVGATMFKPGGLNEAGMAQVFSGMDGSVVYTYLGSSANLWLGYSVSGAGDIDSDGFVDFLVGTPRDDQFGMDAGIVQAFSGKDGSQLMAIGGSMPDARLGWSASGAGDVDNDGFDDMIAGGPFDSTAATNAGMARVISGRLGTSLYDLTIPTATSHHGWSVSGASDIDDDGFDDLLVGAPDELYGVLTGASWVYSGADGSVIRKLEAPGLPFTRIGYAVNDAGDFTGDGVIDFLVGAPDDSQGSGPTGSVRVYSGACFAVESYGSGDAGAGGHTPTLLSTGSLPRIGSAEFELQVSSAVGGAPSLLLLGAGAAQITTSWGEFLLNPALPLVQLLLPLGGAAGSPGQGSATISAAVPNQQSLVGLSLFLQCVIADAASSGGLSHTAGLALEVCE